VLGHSDDDPAHVSHAYGHGSAVSAARASSSVASVREGSPLQEGPLAVPSPPLVPPVPPVPPALAPPDPLVPELAPDPLGPDPVGPDPLAPVRLPFVPPPPAPPLLAPALLAPLLLPPVALESPPWAAVRPPHAASVATTIEGRTK
jgi:hypothetical protein